MKMARRFLMAVLALGTPFATLVRAASTKSVLAAAIVFLVMALVSHVLTSYTYPGHIPDDWKGKVPAAFVDLTQERKRGGGWRYCRKSGKFKPDRCHNSWEMQSQILMLDHFSPWHGTAIGFHNTKALNLAFFYTWALSVLAVAATTTPRTTDRVLRGICCLPLLALTYFVGLRLRLLLTNRTTIELFERPKGTNRNSYDIGVLANVQAVMGWNPLVWLLPVRLSVVGDGLSFPRNDDAKNAKRA